MIRSLEGIVSALGENNVVVTVNNIGYLVYTPMRKQQLIPGETVILHTHLVVRENVLDLYGFTEAKELAFFELLLTIPKVGPKSALQILCQADVSLLSSAVMQQDPDHLHKMSGISKKTATNIVTSLTGKVDSLVNISDVATILGTQLSSAQVDAIDALITLGYDPKEAHSYVVRQNSTNDTKTLVQAALKEIPIP